MIASPIGIVPPWLDPQRPWPPLPGPPSVPTPTPSSIQGASTGVGVGQSVSTTRGRV